MSRCGRVRCVIQLARRSASTERGPGGAALSRQAKFRHGICVVQQFHRASFSGTHATLLCRSQIVVAGEMQPAVHDVEHQLCGEIAAVLPRVSEGGVGRNADFTGESGDAIAFERDDVRRGRIVHEIGVNLGESAVGEKRDREFARRTAARRKLRLSIPTACRFLSRASRCGGRKEFAAPSGRKSPKIGGKNLKLRVEERDGSFHFPNRHVKARMPILNLDGAFESEGRAGGRAIGRKVRFEARGRRRDIPFFRCGRFFSPGGRRYWAGFHEGGWPGRSKSAPEALACS